MHTYTEKEHILRADMFGTGYGFGPPKGPPEGARDASRPKVVVLTKSYKAKTHRQRTFFFTDFQGGPEGTPLGSRSCNYALYYAAGLIAQLIARLIAPKSTPGAPKPENLIFLIKA